MPKILSVFFTFARLISDFRMDFFFREYGQGQPIVILHGWLGISEHWSSIGKFLASSGYKVYIPDLPNHGKSFHTEHFSSEEYAQILNCFCQGLKLKEPILIGHSMGGKIAMEMVNQEPDYFKAQILIDIHYKSYLGNLDKSDIVQLLKKININDFDNISQLKEYFLSKNIDKGWITLILKNLHYREKKLEWRSNLVMLVEEVGNVLRELNVLSTSLPTLSIKGELSDYVLEQDIISFKEVYSNFQTVTIKDAGHWVHVDNPALLLIQLSNYLKSLD